MNGISPRLEPDRKQGLSDAPCPNQAGPERRRFKIAHAVLTLSYIASILLASTLIPDDARPTPGVILLALVPGLIVVGFVFNMGVFLLRLEDEYLRMLEIRKTMVATGLTLAVCGAWGVVELFAEVPRIPVFFVFPLWCLGLGAGGLVNRITLGPAPGGCA